MKHTNEMSPPRKGTLSRCSLGTSSLQGNRVSCLHAGRFCCKLDPFFQPATGDDPQSVLIPFWRLFMDNEYGFISMEDEARKRFTALATARKTLAGIVPTLTPILENICEQFLSANSQKMQYFLENEKLVYETERNEVEEDKTTKSTVQDSNGFETYFESSGKTTYFRFTVTGFNREPIDNPSKSIWNAYTENEIQAIYLGNKNSSQDPAGLGISNSLDISAWIDKDCRLVVEVGNYYHWKDNPNYPILIRHIRKTIEAGFVSALPTP